MNLSPKALFLWLFCLLTPVFGGIYWLLTEDEDWWNSVNLPGGITVFKFHYGLQEQIILSLLYGALIAAPVAFFAYAIKRWGMR